MRVTNVLKPSPNTIDTAKFDHQSTILLPTTMSLEIRSKLTPIAKGNRPNIVVREVRTIGLSLCLQAFIMCNDCFKWGASSFNLLNVSINTILLFTTIPARVTIEMPVIVVLKDFPVINNPSKTPTKDIVTEDKIISD